MEELESEETSNDHESMSTYNKRVERKQKAWEDLRSETIKRTFQFAGQTSCSTVMLSTTKQMVDKVISCVK